MVLGGALCAALLTTPATPSLHGAAVRLEAGQLVLSAELDDPDAAVATVELRVWAYDRPEAVAATVDAAPQLRLTMPAAPFFAGYDSVRLLFVIIALGPDGAELARVGTETEPRSVILTRVVDGRDLAPPAIAPEKPWYRSWWMWIGAAGVVIVAGTVTAAALANDF